MSEALAEYAAALEAIITAMPGRPIINGKPMRPETALADLRSRFLLTPEERAAIAVGRKSVTVDRDARP